MFSFHLPSPTSDHRKKCVTIRTWADNVPYFPKVLTKRRLKLLNYFCISSSPPALQAALIYILSGLSWNSWISQRRVGAPPCKILKELHHLLGVAQRVGSLCLFGDGRNNYRVPLSSSCYHLEAFILEEYKKWILKNSRSRN